MPLHLAAERGDGRMLDLILDLEKVYTTDESVVGSEPASVVQINHSGHAPVGLAACQGHVDVAIRLLQDEKTASGRIKFKRSETILELIVPRLTDGPHGDQARYESVAALLEWATRETLLDVIKALWEHATLVSLETALALSAESGHLAALQYLVEQGVDPNVPWMPQGTQVYVAAEHGHAIVLQYLLGLDAIKREPEDKAAGGDTLLMRAVRNRLKTVVSVLLRSGKMIPNIGS